MSKVIYHKFVYQSVEYFKSNEGYEIEGLPAVFSTHSIIKTFIDELIKKPHLLEQFTKK